MTVTVAVAMPLAMAIAMTFVSAIITMLRVVATSVAIVMVAIMMGVVSVGMTAGMVPAMVRPQVRVMAPVSGVIAASAGAIETMGTPPMSIAPVGPRAHAEEDSVIEVAGAIEAGGGAGVRGVLVIPVRADRRSADLNAEGDLGLGLG